jgi:hypothetical protein
MLIRRRIGFQGEEEVRRSKKKRVSFSDIFSDTLSLLV